MKTDSGDTPLAERGGVNDRFENRSRLAARVGDAIKLA